jgi:CTP synthase (UTP-ammonia lyase)
MNPIQIGIIADYNPKSRYHLATDDALAHAGAALNVPVQSRWLDTEQLNSADADQRLHELDALFCGPGSPYRSMDGALHAVRFAREQGYPFIGT